MSTVSPMADGFVVVPKRYYTRRNLHVWLWLTTMIIITILLSSLSASDSVAIISRAPIGRIAAWTRSTLFMIFCRRRLVIIVVRPFKAAARFCRRQPRRARSSPPTKTPARQNTRSPTAGELTISTSVRGRARAADATRVFVQQNTGTLCLPPPQRRRCNPLDKYLFSVAPRTSANPPPTSSTRTRRHRRMSP